MRLTRLESDVVWWVLRPYSVTTVLGIDVSPFNALCGGVDQAAPSVSACYSYPVHIYEPTWCSEPVRHALPSRLLRVRLL